MYYVQRFSPDTFEVVDEDRATAGEDPVVGPTLPEWQAAAIAWMLNHVSRGYSIRAEKVNNGMGPILVVRYEGAQP